MDPARTTPDALIAETPIQRRSLLQGAAGIAVATFGAVIVGSDAVAQPASAKQAAGALSGDRREAGYRLSDHMRAYYRTARF